MGMLRHGVHAKLEAEADRLIHDSLIGVTSMEEKRDILTPWKQKDRLDHEVYSSEGVPDAATRSGMYHRVYNPASPHLNSRDGVARGRRMPTSLQTFMDEQGGTFQPSPSD